MIKRQNQCESGGQGSRHLTILSVFPAQAGVSLVDAAGLLYHAGLPRASGGEPYTIRETARLTGSSPRKRG